MHTHRILLTEEQLFTWLEQVVTQCNAISFQLFYGSTIYKPVSMFLYINISHL
jgi:hypothetical protein